MEYRRPSHALLLNADYLPLKVISWERAMNMVLEETADLVERYVGTVIRSAYRVWDSPAVVRLRKYVPTRSRVRFSRQNVLSRDSYTCCYCGAQPKLSNGRPDLEELSIDHVVPRARARDGKVLLPWNRRVVSITSWENTVAACVSCNMAKADRTPQEANMALRWAPRIPTPSDILRMSMTRVHIPNEWKAYLLPDSEWRTYWTAELDPS